MAAISPVRGRNESAISDSRKTEALQKVLGSLELHRSEAAKTLVEYLCRQEFLGRAHEVTEQEIAVKALGRPADFAPDLDSSVRTRLMALRKKLEQYYAGEGANDPVRIEIPRGTYVLRFVSSTQIPPSTPEQPVVSPRSLTPGQASAGPKPKPFLIGLLTGLATFGICVVAWQLISQQGNSARDRNLRNAWGPILTKGANVSIVLGTPASFYVRDFGDEPLPLGDPSYRPAVPGGSEFLDWYAKTRNRPLGKNAFLHPNIHSPLWGDAAAASLLNQFFGRFGVSVGTAPGARVHPVALLGKNAVIIGRGEYTDAAKGLTPEDGLAIEYSSDNRLTGVHNRSPKSGEPKWWFASRDLRHNYGLITVIGGEKSQTVLLAGINSDGAEAGARYFTSAEKLESLGKRFAQMGYQEWPSRYQIVVKTQSLDTYSLQAEFEFLRVSH